MRLTKVVIKTIYGIIGSPFLWTVQNNLSWILLFLLFSVLTLWGVRHLSYHLPSSLANMAPPFTSSSSSSMSAHHVIVDSGGFISNAPIKDMAPNVYCTQDVVNEIKDKATKQRLQVRCRLVRVFSLYLNRMTVSGHPQANDDVYTALFICLGRTNW